LTTTNDNVRMQCAKVRKTDERDINAQDCTLQNVTVARFRIARSFCGAQRGNQNVGNNRQELGRSAPEVLKELMVSVDAFVGAARQHDDITCLVLRTSSPD
jgi:hypothetical protein